MNLEITPSAIFSSLRFSLYKQLNPQSQSQNPLLSPPKRIVAAYSGGLDSHVLLHLLSRISPDELDLRAVYVNHGLQEQAADWAKHCHQVCLDLNIPFSSIDLHLKIPKGESLEEVARIARYEALYADMDLDELLVTGHHQNDQAETLLLQLFRGAGVQGLASMARASEPKVKGKTFIHLRPLLDQPRQALEKYAEENGLEHIEDPSNHDTKFDRNFLRQELMPVLRKRWLGIDKAISRTASLQAETKTLLDEIAEEQLPNILSDESNHLISYLTNRNNQSLILPPILIPKLLKLSENKQKLLLRYWISQQGFSTPSAKKLQHIFSDVIQSSKDKQPLVEWKGVELRRFQQNLYIMSPLSSHDVTQIIPWKTNRELHIPSIDVTLNSDLYETDGENVTVRFRQGGETIEIPKRGNISLKNLFQELMVPPWLRPRLPLIFIGEKLIKIVGLEGFKGHPPTY